MTFFFALVGGYRHGRLVCLLTQVDFLAATLHNLLGFQRTLTRLLYLCRLFIVGMSLSSLVRDGTRRILNETINLGLGHLSKSSLIVQLPQPVRLWLLLRLRVFTELFEAFPLQLREVGTHVLIPRAL